GVVDVVPGAVLEDDRQQAPLLLQDLEAGPFEAPGVAQRVLLLVVPAHTAQARGREGVDQHRRGLDRVVDLLSSRSTDHDPVLGLDAHDLRDRHRRLLVWACWAGWIRSTAASSQPARASCSPCWWSPSNAWWAPCPRCPPCPWVSCHP